MYHFNRLFVIGVVACFALMGVCGSAFAQEEPVLYSDWQSITTENAGAIRLLQGLDTAPSINPQIFRLSDVVISPGGKTLIITYLNQDFVGLEVDAGDRIQIWDLETMRLAHVFEVDERGGFEISPDDRWLAYSDSSSETIFMWDLSSGELVQEFNAEGISPYSFKFSPNSKWFLFSEFTGSETKYNLWNLERNALQNVFTGDAGTLTFSPDGQYLLIDATVNLKIYQFDDEGNSELVAEHPELIAAWDVAFSPDGQAVYITDVTTFPPTLFVWDWQNSPVTMLVSDQSGFNAIATSPAVNGIQTYWLTEEDEHQFYSTTTQELSGTIPADIGETILGVIPSSDVAVTYPGTAPIARLWNISTGEPFDGSTYTSVVILEWGNIDRLLLSPTGNYILVVAEDGLLRFWGVTD